MLDARYSSISAKPDFCLVSLEFSFYAAWWVRLGLAQNLNLLRQAAEIMSLVRSVIPRKVPDFARALASASAAAPKKTCLYDFHVSQGGKLVDFAGYLLPIQYGKEGISASHLHTR